MELTGGGVNRVTRAGRTVRRPTGPWTPAVHALLGHLRAAGFTGAPRAHGVDRQGREVLDYLPGEVDQGPLTDAGLHAMGVLVRDFHDATAGFVPPDNAAWYLPPREPREVICHGDVALYNCVRRDGIPVALFDFDTAHPGPRVWDAGYAAYRCVPLTTGTDAAPVGEQARRLRLFADGYRLSEADRAALIGATRLRLAALVDHMHAQAAAGHPAFARHIAEGHDRLYLRDIAHLGEHAERLTGALLR